MKKKIIVIGGGASGMIAAATAAYEGAETVLLEKNERLGKKLYITGKGRCNVTNQCNVQQMIENIPGNGSFLYSALNSFSSNSLRELFAKLGVPTKVERGNRVYPVSDKSSDIIKALKHYMEMNNVSIFLNKTVKGIRVQEGRIRGVDVGNGCIMDATSVIVATGGLSFPSTGSSGDGYRWAKETGHTVTPLRPSLVPIETEDCWVKELQGLTLKNVKLKAVTAKGRIIKEEFGEMLFTHFGVSGPVVLTISSFIQDRIKEGIKLSIDLKPALSHEKLNARLLRDFSKISNKNVTGCLDALLPKSLASVVMRLSNIDLNKRINQITRDERQYLTKMLKCLNMNVKGLCSFNEAVVTAGGVAVKQVDPKTMESKLVKGLFFVGEVLDVDALTGGFNLQIAFSTGYTAGMSCK